MFPHTAGAVWGLVLLSKIQFKVVKSGGSNE